MSWDKLLAAFDKRWGFPALVALLLLAALLGYLPNPVLQAIARHDTDTAELVHLQRVSCISLATLAKTDPADCVRGRR